MFNLIIKIIFTPDNITQILISIISVLGICLVFQYFNEKWWKALIPIYSDLIFYKICYNLKVMALIEFIFDFLNIFALSKIRMNLFDTIIYFIINGIDLKQIDSEFLIIYLIIFFISFIILEIYKRITYVVLCRKININIFLTILTFLFPDIMLFIDILYQNYCNKKR